MRFFYFTMIVFLVSSSTFAVDANHHVAKRYQRAVFTVINQTNQPVAFAVVDYEGTWAQPITPSVPITLYPSQQYQNTLTSLKKEGNLTNYASMDAAQIGNERDNYIIFAEESDSETQSVSQHVFDGLGKIFVGSTNNHCDHNTPAGYANCVLRIKD